MADKTGIEWTEATWNPVSGCSKVSPGCAHCLAPDTPVLMADMSWRPIGTLAPGNEVVGFTESPELGQNRVYERASVVSVWATTAETIEITVGGRTIVASVDHRFLAHPRPYWRVAERLALHTRLVDIGMPMWFADVESEPYLSGYLAGAIAGDGTFRLAGSGKNGSKQSYLRVAVSATDQPILDRLLVGFERIGCADFAIKPFDGGRGGLARSAQMLKIETRRRANLMTVQDACLQERDDLAWKAGYLAGIFDTDGSYSADNLRFHQTKDNGVLDAVHRYITDLGFASAREDFRSAAGRSERVAGRVEEKALFLATIGPALARKCENLFGRRFPAHQTAKIDGIRRVGTRELVDIQTTSGTFIAAGLATHNCYAETISLRFRRSRKPWTLENAAENVALHPERLDQPLRWRRPRMIFVNSMSDLFHELVPLSYIERVFAVMERADQHTFQILTKRHRRLVALAPYLPWPRNVWMGVSIENRRWVERADYLRRVPASVRFISAEPLLGPLDGLDLTEINWLIAGGESGRGHRPMDVEWARELRDRCAADGVAFFFKQWGGATAKAGGRSLDGEEHSAMPAVAG